MSIYGTLRTCRGDDPMSVIDDGIWFARPTEIARWALERERKAKIEPLMLWGAWHVRFRG